MSRPNWDTYFMKICKLVATRSTCLRRKVGAIIVKDKRILASGYNGAPTGLPHCQETGCIRKLNNVPSGEKHELCRGVHAEQNVIVQAAKYGISINNSILYCTNFPCIICAKMIINAGIKKVIYENDYNDPMSHQMFSISNIEVINIKDVK